uniref:Uncharacterized protein n=1 Tax=Moniliophthora roreri TaxID=221103 RepID=A0A0W0F6L0_MONRR
MALVFALEQLEGTNIPTNSATVSNEVPHCFNYRNILTSLCTTGWMSLRIMESPEKRSRYPAIFLSPAVSVKILCFPALSSTNTWIGIAISLPINLPDFMNIVSPKTFHVGSLKYTYRASWLIEFSMGFMAYYLLNLVSPARNTMSHG